MSPDRHEVLAADEGVLRRVEHVDLVADVPRGRGVARHQQVPRVVVLHRREHDPRGADEDDGGVGEGRPGACAGAWGAPPAAPGEHERRGERDRVQDQQRQLQRARHRGVPVVGVDRGGEAGGAGRVRGELGDLRGQRGDRREDLAVAGERRRRAVRDEPVGARRQREDLVDEGGAVAGHRDPAAGARDREAASGGARGDRLGAQRVPAGAQRRARHVGADRHRAVGRERDAGRGRGLAGLRPADHGVVRVDRGERDRDAEQHGQRRERGEEPARPDAPPARAPRLARSGGTLRDARGGVLDDGHGRER